jgi:predicted nucleotidyltransferase
MAPEQDPIALLEALSEAAVDFVVIGGYAVVLQALPRFTKDLDIVYSPDPANLERLGALLTGLHARLRGVDPDLPFVADARTLRQTQTQTQILTLETDLGGLDLLLAPDGAPPFEELRARATVFDLDGITVRAAGIDDLLAMKLAAGRPQDLIDVEALEIARRGR